MALTVESPQTCYTCSYCSVPCQSIVMDLAGKPSCEPCFDSAAYRTAGIPPSPHLAQSGAFSRPLALRPAPSRWGTKSVVTSPTTKLAPTQNKVPGWQVKTARETSAMAPSFDELASKMRLVGLKEVTTKATTSVQVCATATSGTQVPPVSWLARKPVMSPITTSPFKLDTDSPSSSPALPVKVSSPATGRSPSPIRSNVFMTRDAGNPSPSSSPIRSSSPVRILSARGDHSPTRTPSLIRLFGDGTSPKRASILTPRVATTESSAPPKKELTAPSKSWLNLASTPKMEPAVSPFKEPLPLLRPLGTRSRTLSTSPIRTSHLTPKIPPTTSLPASPPKSLVLPGGTHSLSNPSAHLSMLPSHHVVLTDTKTTQENCGVCRRDLGHEGEFVQVQGVGVLHRACFTCGGCEQELGSGKYLMVEQRVFHDKVRTVSSSSRTSADSGCEQCAPPTVKRTVVPRSPKQSAIREEVDVETLVGIPPDGCKGCGKGVRGGLMITIPRTGDSYHQECFKCGGCGVGFGVVDGERSFVEREGTPYHSRVRLQPLALSLDRRLTMTARYSALPCRRHLRGLVHRNDPSSTPRPGFISPSQLPLRRSSALHRRNCRCLERSSRPGLVPPRISVDSSSVLDAPCARRRRRQSRVPWEVAITPSASCAACARRLSTRRIEEGMGD